MYKTVTLTNYCGSEFALVKELLINILWHSGRTDINGGHFDLLNRSGLGLYHYHHGEGPHLHPHENPNNVEIWVNGYRNGKKYVGYLDSSENSVYTNEYEALIHSLGSCSVKVKDSLLEIKEPNMETAKSIPIKKGYVKISDLVQVTEESCGYYVSNTMTISGIYIVELKTDRVKAEILVDTYKVEGYFDPNTGNVYTKDFNKLLNYICSCSGAVIDTDLKIMKPSTIYEELTTLPLKGGHAEIHDLINSVENTCGYYVSDMKTVNNLLIIKLEVKKLVVWIYGVELQGYIKNSKKYLLLHSLKTFVYYIGSEKDYDLVSIYESKLHLIGKYTKDIDLPDYNLLEIESLLGEVPVSATYKIQSSWYWRSKDIDYISITSPYSYERIQEKALPNDFGVLLNEKPPTNDELDVNIWYNGYYMYGSFVYRNGCTYKRFIDTSSYPYGYFTGYDTVEEAIISHSDEEYVSYWFDKNVNTYNITINTDMKTAPIRLIRRGNQINISANFKFVGVLASELFEGSDEKYSEIAIKGIKHVWEGRYFENENYDLFGSDYVDVKVNINNNSFSKSLDCHIDNEGRGFAPYNILWDINGNIFSGIYIFAFQNWMYYIYDRFMQLAAHEFGHLIGLGDAYEGLGQNEAPKTKETPEKFIMRDNSLDVMSNDIEMVLEAFKTNSLQSYSPKYGSKSEVIRIG